MHLLICLALIPFALVGLEILLPTIIALTRLVFFLICLIAVFAVIHSINGQTFAIDAGTLMQLWVAFVATFFFIIGPYEIILANLKRRKERIKEAKFSNDLLRLPAPNKSKGRA
jgi:hypothetical protein